MSQKSWLHIPQSFCGRISVYGDEPTTPYNVEGICTFGFSSCHIVVIIYKSEKTTDASLLHMDCFNHPDVINEELRYYKTLYPDGDSEIFVFKRENASKLLTNKIVCQMKKNKIKYKLISLPDDQDDAQGIGIPNNPQINYQSIVFIKDDDYRKMVSNTNPCLRSGSDFSLIRHPDEWQLVLERRIISRIANIKLQCAWTPYIIYNGGYWLDVVRLNKQNKHAKQLYNTLNKFMSSFTFRESIFDILEKILTIFHTDKYAQKNGDTDVKEEMKDVKEERDFVSIAALSAKILKGFQKYENKNYVLTQIMHHNCQYLKRLFAGINDHPRLHALQLNKIPEIEKQEVISCCNDIIKINDIERMDRKQIIKTLKNYQEMHVITLIGHQLDCYMNETKLKQHIEQFKEVGEIALDSYKCKDYKNAKRLYWHNVVLGRYLYCTPCHQLATACYNYAASSQDLNKEIDIKAGNYFQIAYYMNEELENGKQKNDRRDKILRRLKRAGKTIDSISL